MNLFVITDFIYVEEEDVTLWPRLWCCYYFVIKCMLFISAGYASVRLRAFFKVKIYRL